MYVFGDRYDIAGLRYSTCLAIIDIMADPERHVSYQIPPFKSPSLETAAWAWARIGKTSPVRKLLVHHCGFNHNRGWLNNKEAEDTLQRFPDFAVALLMAVSHGCNFLDKSRFRALVPKPDSKQSS